MVTIEQIERGIAVVEKAVSAKAAEMRDAYTNYLTALGPVVRQHLILASYHLCTQGYAKPFLSLPLTQRQQLQQAILKLGKQASVQLLACIRTGQEIRSEESEENPLSLFEEPDRENGSATDLPENPMGSFSESVSPPLFVTPQGDSESPPSKDTHHCSNPMELAEWQHHLEQAIANTLKTVSSQTNSLLQQAGILPNKLPAQVLEAAVNSSEAAEAIAGPPNLLNLLIETENSEEFESSVTQIVAINLRLSEIEFADATVRAGRKQIRNLEIRVKSLGQEYYKMQRERVVAEAEAAWRASWFDD